MRHLDDCDGKCEGRPDEADCSVMRALLDQAAQDDCPPMAEVLCPDCDGTRQINDAEGFLVPCETCGNRGVVAR